MTETPEAIASSMAGNPCGRSRDLDEKVRLAVGPAVQLLSPRRPCSQYHARAGRDLEGNPAVHAVSALVDRQEQIRRTAQVLQSQVEEELLAGDATAKRCARIASSYDAQTRMAMSKIAGLDVNPVTE